jgi:hypothetical protein
MSPDTMPIWFWLPIGVALWADLTARVIRAFRATSDRPRR